MIPKEITALQEGIMVAHVGTRNSKLQGREQFCISMNMDAPGNQATVFISEKLSGPTLANATDNKQIAVTVTDPLTHTCYQLKGEYISHRKCTDEEHARVKEFRNRFYNGYLKAAGYPPEIAETFAYKPCLALTFNVKSIFNQTPGPGAGKPIDF
jgi:hypothetical protein